MVRVLVIVGLLWSGATALAEPPARMMGDCRLVYSPMPQYPLAVKRAFFPIGGQGTFSVAFDFAGNVKEVKMVRSTGYDSLNDAAMNTLRHWKSAPGRACSMVVPVNFKPEAGAGF